MAIETMQDIADRVIEAARIAAPTVDFNKVLTDSRAPYIVATRMVIIAEARTRMSYSYPEISRAFGKESHSWAIEAQSRFVSRSSRPAVQEAIDAIYQHLNPPQVTRLHHDLGGSLGLQHKLLESLDLLPREVA